MGIWIDEIYKNLKFRTNGKYYFLDIIVIVFSAIPIVLLLFMLILVFIELLSPKYNNQNSTNYLSGFLVLLLGFLVSGIHFKFNVNSLYISYKYDLNGFIKLIKNTELSNLEFVDDLINYSEIQLYEEGIKTESQFSRFGLVAKLSWRYNQQARKQYAVLNFLYDIKFYLEQKDIKNIDLVATMSEIERIAIKKRKASL